MRAIVVGGDGKLGSALCIRLAEAGHQVDRTSRRNPRAEGAWYLDMCCPHLSEYLSARSAHLPNFLGPSSVLYIMAGLPGFVQSSSHPDAWRVNAEAPVLLAQQATRAGMHVVHMSSGAVEMAQETAYGRQKAHADLGVLLLGGCVVRPMPPVPPDKYSELSDLLIRVGAERRAGVVRWGS